MREAKNRGKVIAIGNQKGGVGKTVVSVTVSSILAERGYRVLVIDCDPQASYTQYYGLMDDDVNGSIYHVFTGDAKLSEIIISGIVHPTTQQVINSNLHLAPANIGMTNIEGMQISSKERRLLFAIEEVINDYDYIIIDTPPSLGTLSVASYIAADYILIPNNPDKVSTMGLTLLLNTLSEVRKFHLAKIEIIGVMFSRWNNTKANTETRTILVDKLFKEKMFKTVIPHGTQIDQAQYAYLPITLFDPRSKISQAYENLVDELLTRINMKVVAVNG